MQRYKTEIMLFLALLLSNAIILLDNFIWDGERFLAALALVFVLPGWAWLPQLQWLHTDRGLERIILIGGLSSVFSATALLFTVFLPGPFTEIPVLIAINLVIILGLITQLIQHFQSKIENRKSKMVWPSRTVLLILLTIVAVAAFTRLTRMGYAEFHEDELENMRLIVRAYKGEEYAPFLDSKGPIHWLMPGALWYLNGWVNEGIARTPFAITGLLLIPLIYTLGRRMSDGRDSVGLIAAGFVALNGFFVAYARHVENQSLIVFWGALAMWLAYRAYRERIYHFYILVALSLSIGLIAHPDVLLYLPVFAYIVGLQLWQQRDIWRRYWLWLTIAGLIFASITAFFYIPYLFDPKIGLVYQYFSDDRIGSSLFYNRVHNLFDQDLLYTSRYHAPVLVLLLLWLLIRNFAQWGRSGWSLLAGLCGAMVVTVLWPEPWIQLNINFAFAPYALLTLLVLFLPRTNFEIKTLFLWWAAPLGALLFLAKDAADHIQVAYTAWGLMAALALVDLWQCLGQLDKPKLTLGLRTALVATLSVITGLILFYQYLAFSTTVTAYWQVKVAATENPASIYNQLYGSIPRPRKIFSNPRLGGWKAVGYLKATDILPSDFRSINESFAAPIWYTFQTPRSCYEDPDTYWIRRSWRGWPEEEADVIEQGYTLTRIVLVDQEPMLHLYEKGQIPGEPDIIDLEEYRHKFDRLATPAQYAAEAVGANQTALNFGGDRLRLTSYDLPQEPVNPGDLLPVTVYWEALSPMEIRYRAFMHLVDAQGNLWGQHDDDPACRLLTSDMRPGQRSSRQFRIPVSAEIPPGEYQVILGLYQPDTFERLEIWDAWAEKNVGDHLILGTVSVP